MKEKDRKASVTLKVEIPEGSLINEELEKACRDFGKKQAREIIQQAMSDEIDRIVKSRLDDMGDRWFRNTPLGKSIDEKVDKAISKLADEIGVDKELMLKKLKTKVEAATSYTEESITRMLNKSICEVAKNMGASDKFREEIRQIVANEVRLTYPLQMAQLIDTKEQAVLRQRIAELETELAKYKNPENDTQ